MWVFEVSARVSLNNTPLGCVYSVEMEVGGGGEEGLEESEGHTSSWRVDLYLYFIVLGCSGFPKRNRGYSTEARGSRVSG